MARRAEEIVTEAVGQFGNSRESIIQILTRVNNELSYVPPEAVSEIAAVTGLTEAEVFSVVSFYSFFSSRPRGRNIIRICSTISCAMAGQGEILQALTDEFGVEPFETTENNRITIETTPCIGLCDQAPAMLVNGEPHVKLTPERACEIVRRLK
ncbi:MAG: NAD(P)H-dependent oxidoreductase subunit E [Candidatus Sabulitectum sp.]|nr:NAD(P)H-dependent oxidoreductase subunit E [Candidatus Sabulitectum sp.]